MIERNLSQKEVAIAVGVSRPTVSDWVNCRKDPKGQNLQRLSEFLNLEWQSILIPKGKAPAWNAEYKPGVPMRTEYSPNLPQHHTSSLTDEDIQRIANIVGSNPEAPRTIEARIVSFGMDKLPQETRERILSIVRAVVAKTPEERYFINEDGRVNES